MRILVLHSRYLSGSLSGENRVVQEEAELLREGGHEVDVLAPSPADLRSHALARRTLTSTGVAETVRQRVRADGVDIVHCHNLYPALGAGVIPAASEAGAAVVMTLHNYRLMCIAGTFFRDGHVCEDCLGRTPWPGIVHRCYRGSRVQSGVLAAALTLGRARGTLSSVHRFLAVSGFIREKHIEVGFPARRILVKPNVVPAQTRRDGPGGYFLILSRLSIEKGISDIVGSWDAGLGELRIAGDGPERPRIEQLANGRNVRLVGSVPPSDIPALLAGARALLLPSSWFEGLPRVVVEAYAAGVPVIASQIGGLAEVVVDGESGLTVPLGSPGAWREAVEKLADDTLSSRLGDGAYALWRDRFSPEQGLADLEAAYEEAVGERSRSGP